MFLIVDSSVVVRLLAITITISYYYLGKCCVQHCSDGKKKSSTLIVDYIDSATKGCDCIMIIGTILGVMIGRTPWKLQSLHDIRIEIDRMAIRFCSLLLFSKLLQYLSIANIQDRVFNYYIDSLAYILEKRLSTSDLLLLAIINK